jgi:hypothetical protein
LTFGALSGITTAHGMPRSDAAQRHDGVRRAARLEGADLLQVLALAEHAGPELAVERPRRQHRGPVHTAAHAFGGGADLGDRDHGGGPPGLPRSVPALLRRTARLRSAAARRTTTAA